MKKYAAMIWFEEDQEAKVKFRMLSRELWEEHVNYIARAIVAMLDRPAMIIQGSPIEVEALKIKANQNADAIGNMLIPYYGNTAAKTFAKLLREHIANGLATVDAIKESQDTTELKAASHANGEKIATLLDSLDPINWPHDAFEDLWEKHLDCTADQAIYRTELNYAAEYAAYDSCRVGIMEIADCFSIGIINKFPEEFVRQFTF